MSLARAVSIALGLAAACIAAGAFAADSEKGRVIAGKSSCGDCHGAKGEGQPSAGIPRLAGLDGGYLRDQLVAFAAGTRENATMMSAAKSMDATAMADVSAYYASLPTPPLSPVATATEQITAGEAIASRGVWSANIPPCASCHGGKGLGVGSAFPAITGQSASYIASELDAWKSGKRHDDPLGLMKVVAARMTDAQIAAVAAFYATLPAAKEGTP